MDLIIVESPTKAKTLSKFLGKDYRIEATYGHIRDLPKSKIGIDVEHDLEIDYVSNDKQKKRLAELRKVNKVATGIYLATDPDREGEAIAWHVAQSLRAGEWKGMRRIVFHEITKTAIEEALKKPHVIDMKLVDAQQARRVLDRLVGYKLSPLLWRKVRIGLSAGRVQSVAVRLVVEREREIEQFNKEEYWEIYAELQKVQGSRFKAQLIKKIGSEEEAIKIENELEKAVYEIVSVEKKDFKRTPAAPFTTSTLQQMAANKLGWSAKRTMQAAQALYEQGFITYHRTDSTNIAEEASAQCAMLIAQKFGKEYALERPRVFKTKSKAAQEAHEAIRPTAVSTQYSVLSTQDKDLGKLYELIWRRFVASQMAEARGESTRIRVKAADYGLETKGERLIFDGWYKAAERDAEEVLLPEVNEGEKLDLVQIIKEQKFTQPPARYNDASLIKTLEEMGIGRPSTYAPTLETIVSRRYVEREEKRYRPTNLGIAVNDFLVKYFTKIVDYDFTAELEDTLDLIAKGEKQWKSVITDFYGPFAKELEQTQETAERVKVQVENTGEICPKCQEGEQVIRSGKYGKFLACSRFPECDWKDKYEIKTGIKCPKCSGDVIVKRSKRGRIFYGCNKYPECDFASWAKPEEKLVGVFGQK